MNYYFTGDCHFSHFNIIKYCNRPFKTVEEMNEVLIKNWNSRVSEKDCVIHNGDFGFKQTSKSNCVNGLNIPTSNWMKFLKGNIILIRGNHDSNNKTNSIINNMEITIGGKKIYIVHDPAKWCPNYEINFISHVHDRWKFQTRRYLNKKTVLINIGVDQWKFIPITINEILSEYYRYIRTNEYINI